MSETKVKCKFCAKRFSGTQAQFRAIMACPRCKKQPTDDGHWWIRISGPDDTQPLPALAPEHQQQTPPHTRQETPQSHEQGQSMMSQQQLQWLADQQRQNSRHIVAGIAAALFLLLVIAFLYVVFVKRL